MPTRARIRRSTRRRPEVVELTGRARLDRRTKHLVRRLTADDVAIIDHADLDRVSAEELVESGVRVVVNVSPSSTGQFPEPRSVDAPAGGVRLVDAPGAPLFEQLTDGEWVTGSRRLRLGTAIVSRPAGARRARASARPRRAAGAARGRDLAVCRQHDALSARGRTAARRGHRLPGAPDSVPRPARARRCPRASPQARPAHRPGIHSQLQAGARRRGRRRGRAAGGGLSARRHRRRHGLRHGRDAWVRCGARDPRVSVHG